MSCEARVFHLLAQGARRLKGVSDTPNLDTQLLLAEVLDQSREWLLAHGEDPVTAGRCRTFEALLKRRQAGEPVAYLLGRRHFRNREFTVTPATLVPRPETELLVEVLLDRFGEGRLAVADIGTGSGAIGISLAAERRRWKVYAVDTSAAALDIAQGNATGLDNIRFVRASWCSAFSADSLDIVVSNPPYVRAGDPHLRALTHEPVDALVAGPTGLECIRTIADSARTCLKKGGALLVEHAFDQGDAARTLLRRAGYLEATTINDLGGNPRVTTGSRP